MKNYRLSSEAAGYKTVTDTRTGWILGWVCSSPIGWTAVIHQDKMSGNIVRRGFYSELDAVNAVVGA